MAAGTILFAIGTVWFAIPNKITAGGITGFSTLLHYSWNWNTGVSLFLLNLPLFYLAWRWYKPLFYQSIGSMVISSALIGILEPFGPAHGFQQPWIGSVAGGMIMGTGIGLLGLAGSSLGGGTLTGKMINIRFGWPYSSSTLLIDMTVYPFSLVVIGLPNTLYSMLLAACSAVGILLIEFCSRLKSGRQLIGKMNEAGE